MYRAVAAAGHGRAAQAVPRPRRASTRADVSDVLLPRAELQRRARRRGRSPPCKEFAKAHPRSKIGPEIDAALRQAMLAELETAKAVGTVAALDDFAHKYPDKVVDRELKAARHALYAKALAAWSDKAQVDAGRRGRSCSGCSAWAEKNGPSCEVHFRAAAVEDDGRRRQERHEERALPRRRRAAVAVRDGRRAHAARGPRVHGPRRGARRGVPRRGAGGHGRGDPRPPTRRCPASVPVARSSSTRPSGRSANTASSSRPRSSPGLAFTFESSFVLPDGSAPLKLTTKAWRGAELWKIKAPDGTAREDYEKKVYDAMIDGAFDTLAKKLKDAFF